MVESQGCSSHVGLDMMRIFLISILCLWIFCQSAALADSDSAISMEAAVKIGIEHSPKLMAARMEKKASQIQIDQGKPAARPTMTAKAEGAVQGPKVLFPRGTEGMDTVLPDQFARLEVVVDQPLYRPGMGAANARYHAQSSANHWDYIQQENDLILDIRHAYYLALSAAAMEDVANQAAALSQQQLDLTRLMFQAGNASEQDVRAAEADCASVEQDRIKAANGAFLAKADVNRVLGRNPEDPIHLIDPKKLPEISSTPDSAIQAALQSRPELKEIEENEKAANAGASLALTQTQPGLSAQATVAHQTPSAFVNENYYAASLVVKWNLFDGGQARADAREAKAQKSRLEALYKDAELGIRLDVLKAWRGMNEAKSRMDSAQKQIDAARAALDISRIRYQQRAATEMEVSSSLLNLNRALTDFTRARYDLFSAYADFRHAAGADISSDLAGSE
jgi:outer membrane protein TolC